MQVAEVAAWRQPGQRGQDRAIGPGQLRRSDLAVEHGDLVAQEKDLASLARSEQASKRKPAEDAKHRQIPES